MFSGLWVVTFSFDLQKYQAYKHHWSGVSFPTVLEVTPCSVDQLDPTTNTMLASYNYKDINGIIGKTLFFFLCWKMSDFDSAWFFKILK